jgi:hypothetical protein
LKKISQITFYFVEEGPGRGSEDIKIEYNANCFDFFFFSVFFDRCQEWKNHNQLSRTKKKKKKKKYMHTRKKLEAH